MAISFLALRCVVLVTASGPGLYLGLMLQRDSVFISLNLCYGLCPSLQAQKY